MNYNVAIEAKKLAIDDKNVAIDNLIENLELNQNTKNKIKIIFNNIGFDYIFGRKDITEITNDSSTTAGNIINKLIAEKLIEPVSGKGVYRTRAKRIKR